MQALYALALAPVAEMTGDLNSYGFGEYRSCADAIEQCFVCLGRRNSARWVLEADIKACFDRISHEWMQHNILMDRKNSSGMAGRRICRERKTLSHKGRHSTRWYHFTCAGQYDSGRSGISNKTFGS